MLSHITHVQTIESSEKSKANQLAPQFNMELRKKAISPKNSSSCRVTNCKDIHKKKLFFSKLGEILLKDV